MIGFFSGLKFRYEYEEAKEPLTAVVFWVEQALPTALQVVEGPGAP